MRSRTSAISCSGAVLLFSVGLCSPTWAGGVIFDSLDGVTSSVGYAGGVNPAMSATFSTGPSSIRPGVALLLSNGLLGKSATGATYTVSLNGGIPKSNLSFDPIEGLNYLDGSPVDFQGEALTSITFSVSSLPAVPTIERFDQFTSVQLNPNSLYWIEVRVAGNAVVEWGITADVTGTGVASNYLAWDATDNGFFLNKGVDPFPFDNALQMEVFAVPEPSSWVTILLGFAAVGYVGYRRRRAVASAV
jgi:hypothetical protein